MDSGVQESRMITHELALQLMEAMQRNGEAYDRAVAAAAKGQNTIEIANIRMQAHADMRQAEADAWRVLLQLDVVSSRPCCGLCYAAMDVREQHTDLLEAESRGPVGFGLEARLLTSAHLGACRAQADNGVVKLLRVGKEMGY